MDDAVRAYQEQSRRLLDVAAMQYGVPTDPLDTRENELAAVLEGLDEPDARWLLALIRAKFGRLEPITREVWARAKRG